MLSNRIADALAALDAAVAALGSVDWDGVAPWDRVEALSRLETARRSMAAHGGELIAAVERCPESELGAPAHRVVADVLRITPREAGRRMRDAAQLRPRTTLTGQPIGPELPGTAAAWNAGQLDIEHLRVIQRFVRDLPFDVGATTAEKAEQFLAAQAGQLRPDQLAKLADRLSLELNPDGRYSDEFRNL